MVVDHAVLHSIRKLPVLFNF